MFCSEGLKNSPEGKWVHVLLYCSRMECCLVLLIDVEICSSNLGLSCQGIRSVSALDALRQIEFSTEGKKNHFILIKSGAGRKVKWG